MSEQTLACNCRLCVLSCSPERDKVFIYNHKHAASVSPHEFCCRLWRRRRLPPFLELYWRIFNRIIHANKVKCLSRLRSVHRPRPVIWTLVCSISECLHEGAELAELHCCWVRAKRLWVFPCDCFPWGSCLHCLDNNFHKCCCDNCCVQREVFLPTAIYLSVCLSWCLCAQRLYQCVQSLSLFFPPLHMLIKCTLKEF